MRGTAGNSTAALRGNNANSSLTIGVKKENMNKRIGSVQFDRKVLRNPALHIDRLPLPTRLKKMQSLLIDSK
jgi:hypothetical protein